MAKRKNGMPRNLPGAPFVPMTRSGFCQHPSTLGNSHEYCNRAGCSCECHQTAQKN